MFLEVSLENISVNLIEAIFNSDLNWLQKEAQNNQFPPPNSSFALSQQHYLFIPEYKTDTYVLQMENVDDTVTSPDCVCFRVCLCHWPNLLRQLKQVGSSGTFSG